MSQFLTGRPATTEYAPFYAGYVNRVPEDDVFAALNGQLEATLSFLRDIPEARADYRYAPEKWSIKEVVRHVLDGERIFACRALRFARNDPTPLPGFDQEIYTPNAPVGEVRLADLTSEYEYLRRANVLMFNGLRPEAWPRRGIASEAEVSVRALAFIMVGHERHHMEVLRTRYLA